MEDLFQEGYTERSPYTSDGSTQYIPHHGVYHPAKPGKIIMVFDSGVEYLQYVLTK